MTREDTETSEPVANDLEAIGQDTIRESCRDKEAADRISGHLWSSI
jgi:hypothetical protein